MLRLVLICALLMATAGAATAKGYFISAEPVMSGGTVSVRGKTNLPEGDTLQISLEGLTHPFMAQGDAVVHNGAFRADGFGPKSGILNGGYLLEVSGIKPEYKNDAFNKHALVEASKRFTVASGKIGAYDDRDVAAMRKKTRGLSKKLTALALKGRQMRQLRLYDMPRCMATMRELQPVAKRLRAEADGLPMTGPQVEFGAAAINLNFCVSCLSSAEESCELAEEKIREGMKQIDAN